MPSTTYNPAINSTSNTFKTHLNYVKCIKHLTHNLSININISATATLDKSRYAKFETLSDITKKSIDGEQNACLSEPAYSQVAAPWIPVKCYYRIYYLESIFIYLLCGNTQGFTMGGHTRIRDAIKNHLLCGDIDFQGTNASFFSDIVDWDTAHKFNTTSGATIRSNYHKTSICVNSLQKKVAEYVEFDWKMKHGISNYKTKKAKELKKNDLVKKSFSLADYFYWMRIKANYRDVDFLDFDKDVNENDALEYLSIYTKAADQYAKALQDAINGLKTQRRLT